MIKAIIFDFFGVLAVRSSASFRQTYFPDDPKKIEQVKKIQDKLGLGQIGYDDFIEALAKIGGVDREAVLRHTEDYQPNLQLLRYIKTHLKPEHKIGIISNAGDDWVVKVLGWPNYELFDDIVLSYRLNVIKPQPEIYRISAKNLGVKAPECVFVDDIATYCQGAEAVGMKSVWYKDFGYMKAELEKVLASASNN